MNRLTSWTALVLFLLAASQVRSQDAPRWVGAWATAPMGEHVNPGQPAPANSTYRNVVHINLGGSSVRVQLTNEFGARSLTIASAHIALTAASPTPSGAIQPATDHALTFDGQTSVTIPAGGLAFSDPVPLTVSAFTDLAVSLFLPSQPIDDTTCHQDALSTNFTTPGDTTTAETLPNARPIYSWCFLKGIDVATRVPDAASIVTLGDSITDGALSTRDTNHRWPDVLARRLQADPATARLSVLDEGIGGNRLLHDGTGPNVIARFDRDVIAQTGVRYVIVLEGINDIGRLAAPREPGDIITAQDEIFVLSQLVTRAHDHGIRIFGATITPYIGAKYASPVGEQVREAVNQWIRTSGVFDGVIDFDKATQDPANPTAFLPAVDSGDHLHPGDAGYEKMGSSIDLSLFN